MTLEEFNEKYSANRFELIKEEYDPDYYDPEEDYPYTLKWYGRSEAAIWSVEDAVNHAEWCLQRKAEFEKIEGITPSTEEKVKESERFFLTAGEFFDEYPMEEMVTEYKCNECGAEFFGKWHSEYSFGIVCCPICLTTGDSPLPMIRINQMIKRGERN